MTRERLLWLAFTAAALLAGCRTRPFDYAIGGGDDLGAPSGGGGGGHDGGAGTGGNGGGGNGGGGGDGGGGSGGGGGGPRLCLSDATGRPLQVHAGGSAYTLATPVRIDLYPRSPSRIAVGDVTGDGRADIVGGDLDHVFYLAQRDDGTLAAVQTTQHGFGNPPSIALVDANLDGIFDVVTTSGDGLDVFDMLMGGIFPGPFHVAAPIGWDLQVGDIDGDGHADLVSPSDQGPVVLLGDGRGGLGAPQPLGSGGTQLGYRLALGDVDGDGAPDLVALDGAAKSLVVVPNSAGALATSGWTTVAVSGAMLRGVAIADVDGDGRADLVTQEDTTGTTAARTWLVAGKSGGGFAAPLQIAQAEYGGALIAGDVNGDGRSDVVLMHEGAYSIGVLLAGAGGLGPEHVYDMPTGASLEWLAVADVDCDGCPDVIVADTDGVVVFAGRGCGR